MNYIEFFFLFQDLALELVSSSPPRAAACRYVQEAPPLLLALFSATAVDFGLVRKAIIKP